MFDAAAGKPKLKTSLLRSRSMAEKASASCTESTSAECLVSPLCMPPAAQHGVVSVSICNADLRLLVVKQERIITSSYAV